MDCIKHYLCILAVAAGGLLALEAEAGIIPVDLNDFFADPEVAVAADGTSADFVESQFVSFVRLTNDPFIGDPEVIVAMAGSSLTFGYDFVEAAGGDDSFSAFLFDSDIGVLGGVLETFQVTDTASGTASFALTPYVGFTLGLEFELLEMAAPGNQALGSTATVLDLALVTPMAAPEPGTLALFGLGLAGLCFARRRRAA